MKAKKIASLLLAGAMTCAMAVPAMAAEEAATAAVQKYVFLLIGDGMSYPQV